MSKKILKQIAITLIDNNLKKYFNTSFNHATPEQLYKALASTAVDELFDIRKRVKKVGGGKVDQKRPVKVLHYLSIEVLLGKTLENTLMNLGWDKIFEEALKTRGINLRKIYDVETDAGLGTGGLGRLCACYLESLATLGYPATAHCIKYNYGQFKQRILDGQQTEFLDDWLNTGSVWLTARPDEAVTVRIGGTVQCKPDEKGRLKFTYNNATEIEAIPHDMMLSGYNAKIVSSLKLWMAKAKQRDTATSHGDVLNMMRDSQEVDMINSTLYPNDIEMKLKQQYFLSSASMQSIVNWHIRKNIQLKRLNEFVAIHINDTHPAFCIPELMRILMDDHDFGWDNAWEIVQKCTSYTNHTVMPEALECWESDHLKRRLPRIHEIICEIDRRHNGQIIAGNTIKMAQLAVIASNKVNGVSPIHTKILREKLFAEFANQNPKKFINITNGITHRRFLLQINPQLTEFITSHIGQKYHTEAWRLADLQKIELDNMALKRINHIKQNNKREFAKWLLKTQNIEINPESRFDVQIKRIHEYKRQLLNVMRIIHLYNELRRNPSADITPQTFIFSGKASSGYYMAKRIIRLITCVANEIDRDDRANKILKVVFVENFSVTVSEKLLPAIDVSVQISLAGGEASGTGNMKAVLNGAVMICTNDGANADIYEKCGNTNHFMFGLSTEEVNDTWKHGYHPIDIANHSHDLTAVIDALNHGFNGESFRDIASYLLWTGGQDNYMCVADFHAFLDAHNKMDELYRKPLDWARATISNISNMGYYSADRAIEEYVGEIWGVTKLK